MIGYAYDNNGFYISETQLQENPLELGTYFGKENVTTEIPPITKENETVKWGKNKWIIIPNFKGIKFYNKNTREEKLYEIGEEPDFENYTSIPLLENEKFQKFNVDKWEIDTEAKIKNDKKVLINKALSLLSSSDWTQTLDNLKIRGQEWVNKWALYRSELRKVVNEERNTLPEEIK
jgi:hypothetical protein